MKKEYDCLKMTPKTIIDAAKIADAIKNEASPIILDLENADMIDAVRIVDFLMGVLYVTEGSLNQIDSNTYLILPNNFTAVDDREFLSIEEIKEFFE